MVDFKELKWEAKYSHWSGESSVVFVGKYAIDIQRQIIDCKEVYWLYLEFKANYLENRESLAHTLRKAVELDLFTAMNIFYAWQKEIEATLSDPSAPYEIAREEYL